VAQAINSAASTAVRRVCAAPRRHLGIVSSCSAEFEKLAANNRYPVGDGNATVLSSMRAKKSQAIWLSGQNNQ
jgi:hypothetical protein